MDSKLFTALLLCLKSPEVQHWLVGLTTECVFGQGRQGVRYLDEKKALWAGGVRAWAGVEALPCV